MKARKARIRNAVLALTAVSTAASLAACGAGGGAIPPRGTRR